MFVKNKTLGGVLLIAGTCIGGGMLALPVATATSGFYFSLALIAVCGVAMWLTGLYVLETNLSLPDNANFISMARSTLGRGGEIVAWISYLLLLYSLMAAYLTAGGDIYLSAANAFSPRFAMSWTGPLPWVIVVGLMVYLGVRKVDGLNRFLMLGLIATFIVLVSVTVPHVSVPAFKMRLASHVWLALPVLVASFGYHVIIPSMRHYLKGDVSKLKKVIFYGCVMPFLVYLVWEMVVFGTIPMTGSDGLVAMMASGHVAPRLMQALSTITHNVWLSGVIQSFIFFAIASSFLGISLSLFDFLADGFGIPKKAGWRALLIVMTFLPPLLYAWFFPAGFILAMSYAGVFVAILHGILPALMVWRIRMRGTASPYHAPAGMFGLVIIITLSVLVILAEIIGNLG